MQDKIYGHNNIVEKDKVTIEHLKNKYNLLLEEF